MMVMTSYHPSRGKKGFSSESYGDKWEFLPNYEQVHLSLGTCLSLFGIASTIVMVCSLFTHVTEKKIRKCADHYPDVLYVTTSLNCSWQDLTYFFSQYKN